MNILTGAAVSGLLFGALCAYVSDDDSWGCAVAAVVAALSLILLTLLAGYWTAVLLGKL